MVTLRRILEARHHDPFEVLGRHLTADRCVARALLPQADSIRIPEAEAALTRVPGTDLFVWEGYAGVVPERYRLSWRDQIGRRHSRYDPYCFPPQLVDSDLEWFAAGDHWRAYRFLGTHPRTLNRVSGVRFVVWAPNG